MLSFLDILKPLTLLRFCFTYQIYGDKDADEFYMGECNGLRGLVPSNMVSMVEVDDPDLAVQLLHDSNAAIVNGSVSSSQASSRMSGVTTRTMSTVSQQGIHTFFTLSSCSQQLCFVWTFLLSVSVCLQLRRFIAFASIVILLLVT